MQIKVVTLWILFLLTNASLSAAPVTRNYVSIVGSSTAFPIVSTVAERFGRRTNMSSPVVISMGTGGGFKLFCSNSGLEAPDISMASRKIKDSELKQCSENGVVRVTEIKIGYDGIIFASSKDSAQFHLRGSDLYLALAREVPDPNGKFELVRNPYQRWSEINPALPDNPIRVFGPPPTSGTRDILVESLIDKACGQHFFLRKLESANPQEYRSRCHTLREDGAYINAGESDIRVVRKLINDKKAIGIFGYNYLDQNQDELQAATIDGVGPEYEAIESGLYPLSRPLYLYVNQDRVSMIGDLDDFLLEFTSNASWGDEGYLADKGLIPMSVEERKFWRCKVPRPEGQKVPGCENIQ